MNVVATTNSLFETADESCPLISRIPTGLLIDPCENCASFCHKNGRNWHFSSFSFTVSDNWNFYGFSFMVSDNSTYILSSEVSPRAKLGISASYIYISQQHMALTGVHAIKG